MGMMVSSSEIRPPQTSDLLGTILWCENWGIITHSCEAPEKRLFFFSRESVDFGCLD